MTSKCDLRLLKRGIVAAALVSGFATSALADPPEWCKAIQNGLYCAPAEAEVPHFCGTKKISLALADGFAANGWRQQTTASAINEASRCPNVTSWTHTDGQGNTQKAISDVQGLAAKGTDAIIVFPDAGPAMLPAIRDASSRAALSFPSGRGSVEWKAKTTRCSSAPTSRHTGWLGANGW